MTWANLLESYSIGNRTKIVFGFDNWKGFDHSQNMTVLSQKKWKNRGGFNPKNLKRNYF